jgi:predicted nucleotidyltransferase component of viral defense system
MQGLIKVIQKVKERQGPVTNEMILNSTREYLQVAILKSIYRVPSSRALSFMGGTCLRLCYDTKRYSEDLDFALDGESTGYDFSKLMKTTERELTFRGFNLQALVAGEKTVQKCFFHIEQLLEKFGIALVKGQKLHIKIEVDTNPVRGESVRRETYFLTRYNELFPVAKHDLPTLFAGKILAVLFRPYVRGRDYYDLVWYLRKNVAMNIEYLQNGAKMFNKRAGGVSVLRLSDEEQIFKVLDKRVAQVKPQLILKDVGRLLEDPSEQDWLKQYHQVYHQFRRSYTGKVSD